MKRRRSVLGLLLSTACLACGCGVEGLHNANPRLAMRFNPTKRQFELTSNRDDQASVKGLQIETADGGKVSLESAEFKADASAVREANYVQMQGMALQAATNWQGASTMVSAMGDVLVELLPYVPSIVASNALGRLPRTSSVFTPWGQLQNGTGFTDAQIHALQAVAGSQVTTRPAQ